MASRVDENGDDEFFLQSNSAGPGTAGINFKASMLEQKGTLIVIDTEGTANGDTSHHAKMQAILRYFHALVIYVISNVDVRSMNYLGDYLWKDMKHDTSVWRFATCVEYLCQRDLDSLLKDPTVTRQ